MEKNVSSVERPCEIRHSLLECRQWFRVLIKSSSVSYLAKNLVSARKVCWAASLYLLSFRRDKTTSVEVF